MKWVHMAGFERWTVDPDWASPYQEVRRGGTILRYVPDLLLQVQNTPSAAVVELVGDVTARVAAFGARSRNRDLSLLYTTLLKSESISSSMIEGYQVPPSEVVLTEFAPSVTNSTALIIHRNILALQESLRGLHDVWTIDGIHRVLLALLPDHPTGFRTTQVRIGGRSLFRAAFVPPSSSVVPALMDDLVGYANSGPESIVTKAAIVHAQFETIHPYNDGNGRTGRALIHALFARAGLLPGAVLPVSTVLKARSEEYIGALTAYRYDADAGQTRQDAIDAFVLIFVQALNDAVTLAQLVAEDVALIEADWAERMAHVRADSTAAWAVKSLPNHPALTIESLAGRAGVTKAAAGRAVSRLVDAGILAELQGKYKKSAVFVAPQVMELLTYCERRAASPDLDTLESQPQIPGPRPSSPLVILCGAAMPRVQVTCVLNKGHTGRHRSRRSSPGIQASTLAS